jgi:hypothetical protein
VAGAKTTGRRVSHIPYSLSVMTSSQSSDVGIRAGEKPYSQNSGPLLLGFRTDPLDLQGTNLKGGCLKGGIEDFTI